MGEHSVEELTAAGLVRDGTGPDRLELIRWLESLGFTLAEMTEADARGQLTALAGDRRMVPGPRLTRAEAAACAGLDIARLDVFATALGFLPIDGSPTGEVGFTTDEIAVLVELDGLTRMFSPDEVLGSARVLGSSLGRIGEAFVSMFLSDVEVPHVDAGGSEYDLARKVYDGVGLLDGFTARLDPILRRHTRQATERTRRASVMDSRLLHRFAVGFVDLVGFTERTQDMSIPVLANFIRDFEGRAHDVATAAGARVVKLIGDEVMFVATDAAAACRAAAALTEGFGAVDDRVLPRAGLAFGDVLSRGGDYYGTVVNLASRLVDEAVPEEVLVNADIVAAAGDQCRFEPAGRRMVKGFADPVPVWTLT